MQDGEGPTGGGPTVSTTYVGLKQFIDPFKAGWWMRCPECAKWIVAQVLADGEYGIMFELLRATANGAREHLAAISNRK
jgi:hypothetical protein